MHTWPDRQLRSCAQGQRSINSKDSVCFWWLLYAMVLPVSAGQRCRCSQADLCRLLQPIPWIVLGIIFFSFSARLRLLSGVCADLSARA